MNGDPVTIEEYLELTRGVDTVGVTLARTVVPTPDGDVTVVTMWSGMVLPEAGVKAFYTGRTAPGAPAGWTTLEQYDRPDDARAGHTRHTYAIGFPPDREA